MNNTKMLQMLDEGRIDEIKAILMDGVYQDYLKEKPGAKKRYTAMKKYFGYIKTARTVCLKPSVLEFEGKSVTSFCNSYSLALTTEPCGAIELFTDSDGTYPDVGRLVKREGEPSVINIRKFIARGRVLGYRLTKKEVTGNGFMLKCNNAYFRMGLVDATYSIIDDGGDVKIYHSGKNVSPMVLENDIGICLILPVKCDEEFIKENGIKVIEIV